MRIALVENTHRLRQAVRNIRAFLQADNAAPAEAATGRSGAMTRPLSVAVAGLGTVGAGVLRLLRDNADIVAARAGRPIAVTAVSARDRTRTAACSLAGLRWYDDPVALAADPAVDVVVELIGGADGPARALVQAALAAGKPVVTANKALLAVHGAALAAAAEARGRAAGVRGGGGRRHPGHQGAARGAGRPTASAASPAS